MIIETVGGRRVDALDGRDLRRWHDEWSAPLQEGGKPRYDCDTRRVAKLRKAQPREWLKAANDKLGPHGLDQGKTKSNHNGKSTAR